MAKKKEDEQTKKGKGTLDIAKKAILKKYGSVISTLGAQGDLVLSTISTGSLGLDIALGRGGLARGRIYEFFGPPSGGKTTLAMSVMAQAQMRGLTCCFVDAEHTADPKLFKSMKVNIDDVMTIKAYAGDDNLDALEMLMKTGEIDVAVVDSVSALIPKAEAEAEIKDEFMGLLARLMSKTMRRFVPIASETGTLLIFVNQLRNKIIAYGDPRTTTGGEALGFYATGRISVSGGSAKSSRIVDPIRGEVIGHQTTFEVVKNKLAPPYRKAEVPLIYGVGYDVYQECLNLAEGLGVVERRGAYYYKAGDDKYFANSKDSALEELRGNEEFYNGLKDQIINMTGLKEQYEQNSG